MIHNTARATSAGSTTAVLWLMILLVFIPIGAAHVVARHVAPQGERTHESAKEQVIPGAG